MQTDITAALDRAIKIFGSQPKLGGKAGISQQHISKLRLHQRRVTAEMAVLIETATDGKVNRSELRPDLWPPASTTKAA